MKATRVIAGLTMPWCAIFAALGTVLGPRVPYGPALIFGGIWLAIVITVAWAEWEGFFGDRQ